MKFRFIVALLCTVTFAAHAQNNIRSGPITLDQVIINVLESNPELGMHDYESQAMAARIRQAQQSTPFEVKIELENFSGSGKYKSTEQLETSLSLSKVLELGDKQLVRSELAKQKGTRLNNEQDSKRLDLLAQAAEQFIHVVVDQKRLEINKDHLALVERTFQTVSQRVKAGKSHLAEKRQLVIDVARSRIELEHAKHELLTSRLKLASNWGELKPDFSMAMAELFELPEINDFSQLEKLLSNNPDLIRYASEKRIAQAKLKLAQSQRSSNLQLSGGVRYLNETDDAALMLSLSIPFGTESRARPGIDEMEYLNKLSPLQYKNKHANLYTSLYEIYQELLHARTAFRVLNQTIIPEAKKVSEDYEQGYKTGRFSLLELNKAQSALLDAKLEKVMTAASFHRLKIEIERLTGASLQLGTKQ